MELPKITVRRAIRLKCLECTCDSHKEVRICGNTECPLWPWRMGVSPKVLLRKRPELLEVNSDAKN